MIQDLIFETEQEAENYRTAAKAMRLNRRVQVEAEDGEIFKGRFLKLEFRRPRSGSEADPGKPGYVFRLEVHQGRTLYLERFLKTMRSVVMLP